jgi:cbb3-type cytochrome c oxidase subunit III
VGVCVTRGFVLAGLVIAGSSYFLYTSALAQGQNAGQAPRAPGANRPVAYPARPKAPQEVLDRGKSVYGVHCAFCHGSDAAGGATGPNLLRSSVVLEDKDGELITTIVHGARVDKGMPAVPIEDAQIKDIAAWLHSLRVESRTDPNAERINILTGDAKSGEAYFQKTCAGCHSVTGDLKDIGAKFPNPKTLQQTWLLPGGSGRRGSVPTPGIHVPPTTVTVTLANGQKVEGGL